LAGTIHSQLREFVLACIPQRMPPFWNSVTSALSRFPPKDCGGALGAGRAGGVAHGGLAGVLGEGAIWADLGWGLS